MLNENKISEIKIIIDGLLKDVDSLSETEMISHLKWEEILMSASLISHKLNTLRIEQERNNIKKYLLKEDANNLFDSNDYEFKRLGHTISQLKKEMSEMRLNFSRPFLPEEESQERVNNYGIDQEVLEQLKPEFVQTQAEAQAEQTQAEHGHSQIEAEQEKSRHSQVETDQNELDFLLDKRSIMDIAVSYNSEPAWMKDMPGQPVNDLRKAVTLNDKLFFIRELFNQDEDQYRLSLEKLNDFNSFAEALEYTRDAFEEWDEKSDAAYRFYMILRRRYNV